MGAVFAVVVVVMVVVVMCVMTDYIKSLYVLVKVTVHVGELAFVT